MAARILVFVLRQRLTLLLMMRRIGRHGSEESREDWERIGPHGWLCAERSSIGRLRMYVVQDRGMGGI